MTHSFFHKGLFVEADVHILKTGFYGQRCRLFFIGFQESIKVYLYGRKNSYPLLRYEFSFFIQFPDAIIIKTGITNKVALIITGVILLFEWYETISIIKLIII